MATNMLVSEDKAALDGDILIDDCPTFNGMTKPQWQHILYDRPYNRHFDCVRMDWAHWKTAWSQLKLDCR